MSISEDYVDFMMCEGNRGDYCLVEYPRGANIGMTEAVVIAKHRRKYEDKGVRKLAVIIGKGVNFSREASRFFGKPEEMEKIHYASVFVEDSSKLFCVVMNFLCKFKSNPTTRYFSKYDSCIAWIQKQ